MIVFVGEAPSRTDNNPPMGPTSCTGRRVTEWVTHCVGRTPVAFRNVFAVPTPRPWTPENRIIARAQATKLVAEYPDARFILLGREVARAFGLSSTVPFLAWTGRYVVVPHPSGRTRWYNSPANRLVINDFMKETFR